MGIHFKFTWDEKSKASFTAALEEFARESGWSMEYTALYTAAWLCRDTMWYTPPFVDGSWQGTTRSSFIVGALALKRDILRIFKPMDGRKRSGPAIVLNRLASAAKRGDMSEYFDAQDAAKAITFDADVINKIVRDPNPVRGFYKAKNYFADYSTFTSGKGEKGIRMDEMRTIHESLKVKRRGRLRVTKPTNVLGYHLVKSQGLLNRYIEQRKKMIGRIKSGWWKVMQSLPKPKKKGASGTVGGLRSIASYIKRHGGADGYQTTNFSKDTFSVIIGNSIGDTDGVATRTNAPALAVLKSDERLDSELKRIIEQDISRFNKG